MGNPTKFEPPKSIVMRFTERTLRPAANGCLEWPGATVSGYGSVVTRKDGQWFAHRIALFLKLGRPLTEGMITRHLCNNKLCCNPEHIVEGTHQQNRADHLRAKGY